MRQTQNASKKDNRKSILVIGLLLLLVAVIGFGGYTLSKYVTKKSVKDNNATVAKWGFTVEAKTENLFGDKYKADGTVAADGDTLIVKAETAKRNLVAPGTTGSMTFKIAGKAEVLAKVGVEMKAATDKTAIEDVVLKYKKGESEVEETYAPVKWTLTKTGATDTLVSNGTLAAVQTALNGLYSNNTEIGTEINDEYTLSWEWKFDNTATNPDADTLDTMLGMLSNGTTFTDDKYVTEEATYTKVEANTTISFELVIKVEQIKA